MNKNRLEQFELVGFGVLLYAALMNWTEVVSTFSRFAGYFMPFIIGLVLAFVLSVPVKAMERLIRKLFAKFSNEKLLSVISITVTLLLLGLAIALIIIVVVPVFIESVKAAYSLLQEKVPEWMAFLESRNIDTKGLKEWLYSFDINSLLNGVGSGAGSVLSGLIGSAASTISGVVTFVIGVIIAVYVLFDRERVTRHAGKLTDALFSEKHAAYLKELAADISTTYTGFISGQCLEALIIGAMMYIVLMIMRLPNPALTAILAGVLSFIPYIGPFIACAVGAALSLLVSPGKFLLFIVAYLIVQVVEGQLIYPHVVGNSVGLSPLVTLVSILIGGNIFGLLGMIFFLPLVSVAYRRVASWTNEKIRERKQQKSE